MSAPQRLLLNPDAARGRALARLARLLGQEPIEVREVPSPKAMTSEARRAAEDGLERIVIAGGDGSLHHAIRGLAGTECALGIVPLGTGNDLARALGAPLEPLAALRAALHAPWHTIDLGRVGGVPFAGVAGVGIDGEVNRRLAAFRALPAKLAYAAATFRAVVSYAPPAIEIDYDGATFVGPVLLAAFANSPWFGGGMHIAPTARLDDGQLDLVIVRPVGLATLLRVFPRVYRGQHLDHPAVRTARLREARLRSATPWTVYADGEPIAACGPEGCSIDVWPQALRVVA